MNIGKFCILFALLLMLPQDVPVPTRSRYGTGGVLNPCPDSPNCISSQSENPHHQIKPFAFTGTPESAFAKLKKILAARPDTRIAISMPTYLKVEFKTFLGFIDDGEFYLDAKKKVIECRSASRHGYWDMGKNRERMEEIRSQFNQQ